MRVASLLTHSPRQFAIAGQAYVGWTRFARASIYSQRTKVIKLIEFLDLPQLEIPYVYAKEYSEDLKNRLETYLDLLRRLDQTEYSFDYRSIIFDVVSLINGINTSIKQYLNGYSFKSYNTLFNVLEKQIDFFTNNVFFTNVYPTNLGLFKARLVDKSSKYYSCQDLFHIPLEEYYKVKPYRYSIPGYPCLYLGTSSLLCVRELYSNDFKNHNIIFSRYVTWNGLFLKILFLGYNARDLIHIVTEKRFRDREYIFKTIFESYLRIIPLIIAVSAMVRLPEENFRPEYIIPQMVMQYVREKENINAVCFISTKSSYKKIPKPLGFNYVFPVPSQESIDNLRYRFLLTKPLLFSKDIIRSLTKKYEGNMDNFIDQYGTNISFKYNVQYKKEDYWRSLYGKFDRLLQYAPVYRYNDKKFLEKNNISDYSFETNIREWK